MIPIVLIAITILLHHCYCTWSYFNSWCLVIRTLCHHFAYSHYYFRPRINITYLYACL